MSAQIIPGGKAVITVRLRDQQGDPIDLSGLTEAEACFQNSDGSELTEKLTTGGITVVGDAKIGKLAITISAAATGLLAVVDSAPLNLKLTFGAADPVSVWIENAYSVLFGAC